MGGDACLLKQFLEGTGMLRELGRAEGEIDVHRYPVDLVGTTNPRLDLAAQVSCLGPVVKCERQAVALNESDRHIRRYQFTPALADQLEQLLAEESTECVLNIQEIFDLHDNQQDLRTVALDGLPLCPGKAGTVEKPCAGIVLV